MRRVTLSLLLFLLVGCAREHAPSQAHRTSLPPRAATTTLAIIAEDERPDTDPSSPHPMPGADPNQMVIAIHGGGYAAAYIARSGSSVHVTFNGKRGKPYDAIDGTTLVLSPDGQRVAYCARKGGKWFVVVDEREYGPFVDKGPPVFSPDSSHVAFEARDERGWRIVADTGESPRVNREFEGPPVFSADSRKIARFELGEGSNRSRFIISDLSFNTRAVHEHMSVGFVDDPSRQRIVFVDQLGPVRQLKWVFFEFPTQVLKGPIFDEIFYPRISDDGKVIAYLGRRKSAKYVGIDSREEKLPEGGAPLSPFLTPFGTAAVVIEGLNGTYVHHAFSDRKLPVPARYKECNEVVFTPDGKNHAYVAIRDNRFIMVCNGIEQEGYDRVISPRFTPDGKYLVYRARRGGKRFVVVADPRTNRVIREFPPYDRVYDVVILDGGKSIGYGVVDGRKIIWKVETLP